MSTFTKAIVLAAQAHHGQMYGEVPYICHCMQVALAMDTDDERLVAILHDVIEDTDVTFDDLRAAGFSDLIIDNVVELTHEKNQPYDDYILSIRLPIAKKVKRKDVSINYNNSLTLGNSPVRDRRLWKYHNALKLLAP